MIRLTTIAVTLLLAGAVGYGANAVSGGPSAEHVLRQFDQHLMDAWTARLPAISRQSVPRVDGYVVERRVPLPLLSYYRGQSTVAGNELSCASRNSVVAWYGTGSILVWQDGVWFPDRPEVHTRFATSGLLR
jgi:hypothetical protein